MPPSDDITAPSRDAKELGTIRAVGKIAYIVRTKLAVTYIRLHNRATCSMRVEMQLGNGSSPKI